MALPGLELLHEERGLRYLRHIGSPNTFGASLDQSEGYCVRVPFSTMWLVYMGLSAALAEIDIVYVEDLS